MKRNHQLVWQAVASELAQNSGAFTEQQVEDARAYAEADDIDRWRYYKGATLTNPLCSAIQFSEMDSIDRHRNRPSFVLARNPEERLVAAVREGLNASKI
jgi:hypothetical protein